MSENQREMTKAEIVAARYAGLSIPPMLFRFDLDLGGGTSTKIEVLGRIGPGTADRLERLFSEIIKVVREAEHPPIKEDQP